MAELDPREEILSVNRWPLVLGVLGFLSLAFYMLQPILLPFVLGGLIAYLGDPLVDWLERHKLNRTEPLPCRWYSYFLWPLLLRSCSFLYRCSPGKWMC